MEECSLGGALSHLLQDWVTGPREELQAHGQTRNCSHSPDLFSALRFVFTLAIFRFLRSLANSSELTLVNLKFNNLIWDLE